MIKSRESYVLKMPRTEREQACERLGKWIHQNIVMNRGDYDRAILGAKNIIIDLFSVLPFSRLDVEYIGDSPVGLHFEVYGFVDDESSGTATDIVVEWME